MKKITTVHVSNMDIPVYYVDAMERRSLIKKGIKSAVACCVHYNDGSAIILVFNEFYEMPHKDYVIMHEVGHIMSYPDTTEEAANEWAVHQSGLENAFEKMQENYALTDEIIARVRKRLYAGGAL